MEASLERFRGADTQVLGISIDSVYSHANWARNLGGISFPLLADFHPKGAVAESLGLYLADAGITDRATVIIDKGGLVQHSVSVTPGGKRDISELASECEKLNGKQAMMSQLPEAGSVPAGACLYVKNACGHSRKTLLAVDNLHLRDAITVKNVSEDAAAASELKQVGGKDQAPCLMWDGEPVYEADDIVKVMANRVAPV